MEKLVVIDGNSILNRAFYGIMGNKMLQTADGTYTNAVYGFLNIMFKVMDDIKPEYLVVAFDVKSPTKRHELYKEYKGTRKGMPDELASQMPIIKSVLQAMNIKVIEKAGYEADDVLGTLAKFGEKNGLEVTILTGDRDSFQLATNKVTIRIPRTKQGKTEIDDFNRDKVLETYGVEPKALIEVKGLMGDASDNIPGVAGIGEKTAINLIKTFGSIEEIYKKIDEGEPSIKGKVKENLVANKDLAFLSKTLGTIDTDAPIDKDLKEFKVEEWNKSEVLTLFKELRFKRFIERFDLENSGTVVDTKIDKKDLFEIEKIETKVSLENILRIIRENKIIYYFFETVKDEDCYPIAKRIVSIKITIDNKIYSVDFKEFIDELKEIFEDENVLKCGYELKLDYILLKQVKIEPKNMMFDIKIAGHLLNSNSNQYSLKELSMQYLEMDIDSFLGNENEQIEQTSLFDEPKEEAPSIENEVYSYTISKLHLKLQEELEKIDNLKLFNEVEMPLIEVLSEMQYVGVYADVKEIIKFGETLKANMEELRIDIYNLAGEEFNINSTKQLGEILFEKLKLPVYKKTKSGYSTDVDVLEKLKSEHPIIEKILSYRQIAKLNSTYVEGLVTHINEHTGRIHTYFHQTVTTTGRLSSTEPNLQNIPTRTELGKKVRKVFKAEKGKIFLDADYSQIELRILADMSQDEIMCKAFREDADIHTICASQIFNVPIENVSKQLRSRAKAVNFGIVYGISEFGLAEQTGINRKEAKQYIEEYLNKYSGIKNYMDEIVEIAKRKGYVDTKFGRRRYIPELSSNNYMVRKFGDRAAMNTPIQGTAADIMKIAMINVYKKLKEEKLKSRIVLQIHDELLIEAYDDEKELVAKILKEEMENACTLSIPLKVEVESGKNWYQAK